VEFSVSDIARRGLAARSDAV